MPEASAGPSRSEYADDVMSFTDLLMTDLLAAEVLMTENTQPAADTTA